MLKKKIENDLKQALPRQEEVVISTLRLLLAAIKNEEILKKKKEKGLTREETIVVLKREVKKRNEAIEFYEKGGRKDLAEKERKEIEIIKKYLPPSMGEGEIKKVVQETIKEMEEISPSQFGKVMGQVMAKLKGKAEGLLVSKVVKEYLDKIKNQKVQPEAGPPLAEKTKNTDTKMQKFLSF